MEFKFEQKLHERLVESRSLKTQYPDRVAVICERQSGSKTGDISKKKLLVSGDLTYAQFTNVIRKRLLKLMQTHKNIFVFIDGESAWSGTTKLSSIHEKCKNNDGFLYVTYSDSRLFERWREPKLSEHDLTAVDCSLSLNHQVIMKTKYELFEVDVASLLKQEIPLDGLEYFSSPHSPIVIMKASQEDNGTILHVFLNGNGNQQVVLTSFHEVVSNQRFQSIVVGGAANLLVRNFIYDGSLVVILTGELTLSTVRAETLSVYCNEGDIQLLGDVQTCGSTLLSAADKELQIYADVDVASLDLEAATLVINKSANISCQGVYQVTAQELYDYGATKAGEILFISTKVKCEGSYALEGDVQIKREMKIHCDMLITSTSFVFSGYYLHIHCKGMNDSNSINGNISALCEFQLTSDGMIHFLASVCADEISIVSKHDIQVAKDVKLQPDDETSSKILILGKNIQLKKCKMIAHDEIIIQAKKSIGIDQGKLNIKDGKLEMISGSDVSLDECEVICDGLNIYSKGDSSIDDSKLISFGRLKVMSGKEIDVSDSVMKAYDGKVKLLSKRSLELDHSRISSYDSVFANAGSSLSVKRCRVKAQGDVHTSSRKNTFFELTNIRESDAVNCFAGRDMEIIQAHHISDNDQIYYAKRNGTIDSSSFHSKNGNISIQMKRHLHFKGKNSFMHGLPDNNGEKTVAINAMDIDCMDSKIKFNSHLLLNAKAVQTPGNCFQGGNLVVSLKQMQVTDIRGKSVKINLSTVLSFDKQNGVQSIQMFLPGEFFVAAGKNVVFNHKNLSLAVDRVVNHGNINAKHSLGFFSKSTLNSNGSITAGDNLSLSANGQITLSAEHVKDLQATISAGGSLRIQSFHEGINTKGVQMKGAIVTLEAEKNINLEALIYGKKNRHSNSSSAQRSIEKHTEETSVFASQIIASLLEIRSHQGEVQGSAPMLLAARMKIHGEKGIEFRPVQIQISSEMTENALLVNVGGFDLCSLDEEKEGKFNDGIRLSASAGYGYRKTGESAQMSLHGEVYADYLELGTGESSDIVLSGTNISGLPADSNNRERTKMKELHLNTRSFTQSGTKVKANKTRYTVETHGEVDILGTLTASTTNTLDNTVTNAYQPAELIAEEVHIKRDQTELTFNEGNHVQIDRLTGKHATLTVDHVESKCSFLSGSVSAGVSYHPITQSVGVSGSVSVSKFDHKRSSTHVNIGEGKNYHREDKNRPEKEQSIEGFAFSVGGSIGASGINSAHCSGQIGEDFFFVITTLPDTKCASNIGKCLEGINRAAMIANLVKVNVLDNVIGFAHSRGGVSEDSYANYRKYSNLASVSLRSVQSISSTLSEVTKIAESRYYNANEILWNNAVLDTLEHPILTTRLLINKLRGNLCVEELAHFYNLSLLQLCLQTRSHPELNGKGFTANQFQKLLSSQNKQLVLYESDKIEMVQNTPFLIVIESGDSAHVEVVQLNQAGVLVKSKDGAEVVIPEGAKVHTIIDCNYEGGSVWTESQLVDYVFVGAKIKEQKVQPAAAVIGNKVEFKTFDLLQQAVGKEASAFMRSQRSNETISFDIIPEKQLGGSGQGHRYQNERYCGLLITISGDSGIRKMIVRVDHCYEANKQQGSHFNLVKMEPRMDSQKFDYQVKNPTSSSARKDVIVQKITAIAKQQQQHQAVSGASKIAVDREVALQVLQAMSES